MEYKVNNKIITYNATGERAWGAEEVLLDKAVDLTSLTTWHEQGFTIETLFENNVYKNFIQNISDLLKRLWREAGLLVTENFQLENYHTLTPDFETHLKAVDKTKLLSIDDFPIELNILIDRISSLFKTDLTPRNPFDNQLVFHFRVIRPAYRDSICEPNVYDNNPLHRDVWLEDYDNCINLYIPIAGSDELSSLILLPGSHHWPESRIERTVTGAEINGRKFNVPAVTAIQGPYEVARPNPQANEVLIFSPYLIHGGAVNLNTDTTRISIEMRLWKK